MTRSPATASAASLLRAALSLLNDGDAWYKGALENENATRMCAAGALARASGRRSGTHAPLDASHSLGASWLPPELARALRLLNEVAGEQYPDRLGVYRAFAPISSVNDHLHTTFDDVNLIFEKAIIHAEETP